jgi:fumarylacetoacetate (FAA) hydrolase family protein
MDRVGSTGQRLVSRYVEPSDAASACLVGRAWVPASGKLAAGPSVVAVRSDGVYDLSQAVATMSELLDLPEPAAFVRAARGELLGSLATLLSNSDPREHRDDRPWLLAPVDLQAVKAAGVTFAASLLERVVEEQARGDPAAAEAIRRSLSADIGADLSRIKPGSADAERLRGVLKARGLWSQYLEVGIGPDAEIFTKSQPLSAVGFGADVGLHPKSVWNNPEPEIVVLVSSRGDIVGAALGNDVNLRDFEGRSALLLGKAKDNNASAAIGPFVRLFDGNFALADVEQARVTLVVEGEEDGFVMQGESSMSQISRSVEQLVEAAMGSFHQYPDGMALYLGTMFAPTQDRDRAGGGFTHKLGDIVTVRAERLGCLVNRVNRSDLAPPWLFGTRALMANLAARGLLNAAPVLQARRA